MDRAPTPPPAAPERPAYRSPEVLPDGRVVFRLWAPRAQDVTVGGTFRFHERGPWPERVADAFPLARGADGIWEYATRPLEPGFYVYGFQVDGVPVVDPQNPHSRPLGLGVWRSYLAVDGQPGAPALHEARAGLPRGVPHLESLASDVLGREVGCWVYTPPGYDPAAEPYPVLYLLHGRGDDERGWAADGRATAVLDTVIGTGAIRPVVVAMPYGQLTALPGDPTGGTAPSAHPLDPSRPTAPATGPRPPNPREGEYFLWEVAGMVEARYRVRRDAAGRALAGLSMGGGQALRLLLERPGAAAAVGAFSAALGGGGGGAEPDEGHLRAALAPLRTLYLARGHLENERLTGSFDRLAAAVRALAPDYPNLALRVEVLRGGHEWQVWIGCLAAFLQLWQPR